LDQLTNETTQALIAKGLKVIDYNEFVEQGKDGKISYDLSVSPNTPHTIAFTSGTTGDVILIHN